MIEIGRHPFEVVCVVADPQIPDLRAERAKLLAEQAADEAGLRERTATRRRRQEEISAGLLDGRYTATVPAVTHLDELTGEVVELHADTGEELSREAPDDAMLLRFCDPRVRNDDLRAAAAKLAESRGLAAAKVEAG